MHVEVTWAEILGRLALTVLAGALLGFNRSERGRAAGLCTVSLVCLAASISMIQTNALLITVGKTPESFGVLDMMRLPLGILTGMGFIGGGVILRRGNMILGVTTAATLWMATVIGLCFGGGQYLIGILGLALALFILWGLKTIEKILRRDRRAILRLRIGADGPTEPEIRKLIDSAGYGIAAWLVTYAKSMHYSVRCEVRWHGDPADNRTPSLIDELRNRTGVLRVGWKIEG